MTTDKKDRREKAERRRAAERRTKQTPVDVERRTGDDRRTGLERRAELNTAGDQIEAAIGLLAYAAENAVMLDVDLWVLETAITRLQLALAKLSDTPQS
jgi:hypothetical protein